MSSETPKIMARNWKDPKPRFRKSLFLVRSVAGILCYYCGLRYKTNRELQLHTLRDHNFQNPKRQEPKDEDLSTPPSISTGEDESSN